MVGSAYMLRSTLEGVGWTGQMVQHLGKALKLLWSYLAFRCGCITLLPRVIWLINKEHVPEICAICKPMNLLQTHFCATYILLFPWQNLVMQHVDHSAGDIIDLLQGLLRHDPANRLTAHEALRHPFFTRYRRFWVESSIILSYVDIGNDLLSERVELADVGSWIAFNYHVTVFLDFVREWMA